jgi:hypothetical protein
MARHKIKTERFLPDDAPGAIVLGLSLPQHAPINDARAEPKQKVTLVATQEKMPFEDKERRRRFVSAKVRIIIMINEYHKYNTTTFVRTIENISSLLYGIHTHTYHCNYWKWPSQVSIALSKMVTLQMFGNSIDLSSDVFDDVGQMLLDIIAVVVLRVMICFFERSLN